MVLKSAAYILAILGLIGLAQGASLTTADEAVVQQKENNEMKEIENMLLREILENAALKSQLRNLMEIVNAQVTDENDDDDEYVNEDNSAVDGSMSRGGLMVAKRFPKWRSGDTRSRVRLLHQHDGRHQAINAIGSGASSSSLSSSSANSHHNSPASTDYSTLLRNRWENNMLEKNRMYQNLLG